MSASGLTDHELSVRLNTLIRGLADALEGLKAEGSRAQVHLGSVIIAQLALREFLASVPELNAVAAPVDLLISNLEAIANGRTAEMFEPVSVAEMRGRPEHSTHRETQLRVETVMAAMLLQSAGISTADSHASVERVFDRARVKQTNGHQITAATVEGWTRRLRSAAAGTDEHKHMRQLREMLQGKTMKETEAIERVNCIAANLALINVTQIGASEKKRKRKIRE